MIDKVAEESGDLSEPRVSQVRDALSRVRILLETPAQKTSQAQLLLSAAIRMMRDIERLMIESMLGDEWIAHREEAVVVHIRLACAELIALLTAASDELRLVSVPAK